jgi:hypothetical protein
LEERAQYNERLNSCEEDTNALTRGYCTKRQKKDYDGKVANNKMQHDNRLDHAREDEAYAFKKAKETYDAAIADAERRYCVAYKASGHDGPVAYTGVVCSLEGPFTVLGIHPAALMPFKFVPSGPAAGTMSYSVRSSGILWAGSGSYTIDASNTARLRILVHTNNTASVPGGSGSGSGDAHIDLVPFAMKTSNCGAVKPLPNS